MSLGMLSPDGYGVGFETLMTNGTSDSEITIIFGKTFIDGPPFIAVAQRCIHQGRQRVAP